MWYNILNLVRKVINTNKYSTSLISKITKITMIDIKIYGTIVFFVVFTGGGGGVKKNLMRLSLIKRLYSSVES